MADMTSLADILNGDPASAADVQNNFQTIEAYINGTDLVRTDGTEVMTANLDMDSNKVVNLAAATVASDAPRFDQTGVGDSEVTAGTTVVPASGSAVLDTISVTMPAAGSCLLLIYGTFDHSSTTTVGFGDSDSLLATVTGGTFALPLAPVTTRAATIPAGTGTNVVMSSLQMVGLAAGANTLTIAGSRAASGGTVTVDTGLRTTLIGAF